jgi:ABC-type transport system involved in multi-copper enzyme maturation permease subunit
MRNVPTIARRELSTYFYSPLAYVVLTLFLLFQGWWFWALVEVLAQPNAPHGAVMQFYFGGTFLFWMILIFVVSTITMRLIAEERRTGTIETLLTCPVTDTEVVLGKYLGALLFYAFLWLPTVAYVFILRAYSPDGQGPEAGPVLAGYLGTLLVGATFIAAGLLASSLTRNQIIAAVLAFVFLALLLLLGVLEMFVQEPAWRDRLSYANLFSQMEDFGKGIVDSRPIVFHLSLTVFFLFAAVRVLQTKKGEG